MPVHIIASHRLVMGSGHSGLQSPSSYDSTLLLVLALLCILPMAGEIKRLSKRSHIPLQSPKPGGDLHYFHSYSTGLTSHMALSTCSPGTYQERKRVQTLASLIALMTCLLNLHVHDCMLSHFSRVRLFATLWSVAHQTSLFKGFSRQEYWSRLPFPPPGDLPNPEINPKTLCLLHWQASSLPLVPPWKSY